MGKRGYSAAQIQGVLEKAAEATRVARARPAARLEVAPGGVGGAASGAVGATAPGGAASGALGGAVSGAATEAALGAVVSASLAPAVGATAPGGAASGAVGGVAPGVVGDAALPPSPTPSASGVDSGDSSETITAQSGRWWLG